MGMASDIGIECAAHNSYLPYMEPTFITLEGRSIPITVRRHARARRISLRLSECRDSIFLTLPRRAKLETGLRFIERHKEWVLKNLKEKQRDFLEDGAEFTLLGAPCVLRRIEGRGTAHLIQMMDGRQEMRVYGGEAFITRRTRDFIKKEFLSYCTTEASRIAASLDKQVRRVTLRDMRSRWGSCSSRGILTFNWRLAFAPRFVTDYLIAHEVTHLVDMTHGKRFWNHVERLCPQTRQAKAWLKSEGHLLYQY